MEIFRLSLQEFDDMHKKINDTMCRSVKTIKEQYKDLLNDEDLINFNKILGSSYGNVLTPNEFFFYGICWAQKCSSSTPVFQHSSVPVL